jgi:hypothetical protein
MYRCSTHTLCAGCGGSLALDQAELDADARFVCIACGARGRLDRALARWRRESRKLRYWHALAVVALVPPLVCLTLLVVPLLLFAVANLLLP